MRQVGIIAAGALYALTHHRERMVDDHANAKRLAMGLIDIPGIRVNCEDVESNMVYLDVENQTAAELVTRLNKKNVLVLDTGLNTIRAVTNLEVEANDIDRAIDDIREVMTGK